MKELELVWRQRPVEKRQSPPPTRKPECEKKHIKREKHHTQTPPPLEEGSETWRHQGPMRW
jgi:hypothetical protein